MRRLLPILAMIAAAALPAPALASGVMLRETIVVNDDMIRLGDLFTNAGPKAEATIAYAPAPGKRAVFDARWLWRVAYAYGLPWQPMSIQDRAVVERDSQAIEIDTIEDALREALLEQGIDPDSSVVLSNRTLRLYVPGDAAATVAVRDVVLDERSGHFSALLVAPADDSRAQPIRVTGSVHRMLEVPVLKERVRSGAVIRSSDISWIRVRADRLQRDIVVDAGELIGKAPKRSMRAGHPLRAGEIAAPLMVEKGSQVVLIVKNGSMTLTAKGTALEDGAEDASIRVSNLRSGTVVEGRVVGPDTVVVDPAAKLALSLGVDR